MCWIPPSPPCPAALPSPPPRHWPMPCASSVIRWTWTDKALIQMADFFKGVRADFLKDGTLDPISMATDTQCLNYQIPGGMLSNLISQLKMMNAMDKLDEALAETPKVRADLGYPPLVTPTSQMGGLSGLCRTCWRLSATRSWARRSRPTAAASTAALPHPSTRRSRRRSWATPLVKGRFADSLEPEFEKTKKELGDTAKCDEDVLSYIAFPRWPPAFFKDREAWLPKKEEPKRRPPPPPRRPRRRICPHARLAGPVILHQHPAVTGSGYTTRAIQPFAASYQPPHLMMGNRDDCTGTFTVTIDGKPFQVSVEKADAPAAAPAAAPVAAAPWPPPPRLPLRLRLLPPRLRLLPLLRLPPLWRPRDPVNSPMPGNIFKVECKPGQAVKASIDVLIVLEAMKMEIEVSAPVDGTVKSVAVNVGGTVNTGDLLVVLG